MPRPRSPSDKVAAALALMDEGHSAEEAAAQVGGVSMRTLYRRRGEAAAVPASSPLAAARPPPPLPPATNRGLDIDRMPKNARMKVIDDMTAKSPVLALIMEALGRALAAHPEAAADVARELRAITL